MGHRSPLPVGRGIGGRSGRRGDGERDLNSYVFRFFCFYPVHPVHPCKFMLREGIACRITCRTGLVAVTLLGLLVNASFAADDKADEDAGDDLPVYAGEEIVVTESKEKVATIGSVASKIPVPLSETPASVSVVNRGLIDHQSGVVLGDALRNVSGVNVQTVFGVTDFFVIRGFDSLSSGLVLTDGASEPEATFYNLYNLDRVEVLKGPGAFLYGANPLSGSVNLNRKQPVFEPMFQARGAYGPFGSLRGTVDGNWADPAQGVAARFNGLRQVSDNYRDDKHSGIWALNPAVTLRNERRRRRRILNT